MQNRIVVDCLFINLYAVTVYIHTRLWKECPQTRHKSCYVRARGWNSRYVERYGRTIRPSTVIKLFISKPVNPIVDNNIVDDNPDAQFTMVLEP